jgi:hypothetical protein
MPRVSARRPSPALVISLVALFGSLTGVGWAALDRNSVKSKTIKDGHVRTADVADDSGSNALTGEDLSDAGGGTLGETDLATGSVGGAEIAPDSVGASELAPNSVASANVLANTLTGADVNEATLDGTPRKFRRAMTDSTLAVPILNLGGLRIEAGCSAAEDLTLIARGTIDNAVLHLSVLTEGEVPQAVANADFEENETLNLHPVLPPGNSIASGTLAYTRPDGSVVTANLVMGQGFSFHDGTADCLVAGQAWRSA